MEPFMKRILASLSITLLLASTALAHDPKLHKGPKVEGRVVSLKGDHLEVETKDGTVAVALSPETKYEQGMAGEQATKSVLKEGQHVMVTGHKLESGEFGASEVMVHTVGDHAHDPSAHSHADGGNSAGK
jgi:hypothetical protein